MMGPGYIVLLVLAAFANGLAWGILFEKKQSKICSKDEEIPYKKVKRVVPKFNFGDQLDPIVPENTKRPAFAVKEAGDGGE